MDRDALISNIENLCEARGEKVTNVCIACGVGHSFVSDIKRGRTSSVAKFSKLAEYLGVTLSDLMGDAVPEMGTKNEPVEIDELERQFIDLLREVSPAQKEALLQLLRGMTDKQ